MKTTVSVIANPSPTRDRLSLSVFVALPPVEGVTERAANLGLDAVRDRVAGAARALPAVIAYLKLAEQLGAAEARCTAAGQDLARARAHLAAVTEAPSDDVLAALATARAAVERGEDLQRQSVADVHTMQAVISAPLAAARAAAAEAIEAAVARHRTDLIIRASEPGATVRAQTTALEEAITALVASAFGPQLRELLACERARESLETERSRFVSQVQAAVIGRNPLGSFTVPAPVPPRSPAAPAAAPAPQANPRVTVMH